MPFVPMANGARVELVHTLFGRPCEVTVTLLKHQVVTPPTLETAAGGAFSWWTAAVLPLLSRDLQLVSVVATDISVAGGEVLVVDAFAPVPGGYTAGSLPAIVSVRVNYLVEQKPGRHVGCMFLPGVPADQVAGNRVSLVWKALVFDAMNSFIDLAAVSGWRWVVESKFLGGVLRTNGEPYRVVTAEVTSTWVAQRRKRGSNELRVP
jgi:hypothetical protein